MQNINKSCLFICFILMGVMLVGLVCAGQGGASVPITKINLTEQGINYDLKPGRLIFDFNEGKYAIQIRRIKQEYTTFLVMTLDKNKLDDITAYTLEDFFNLSKGGIKEIDLDKDGVYDITLNFKDTVSRGAYNSVKSAGFSVKKIKLEKEDKKGAEEISKSQITGNLIQEQISAPIYSKESFFDNAINWFRGLFK